MAGECGGSTQAGTAGRCGAEKQASAALMAAHALATPAGRRTETWPPLPADLGAVPRRTSCRHASPAAACHPVPPIAVGRVIRRRRPFGSPGRRTALCGRLPYASACSGRLQPLLGGTWRRPYASAATVRLWLLRPDCPECPHSLTWCIPGLAFCPPAGHVNSAIPCNPPCWRRKSSRCRTKLWLFAKKSYRVPPPLNRTVYMAPRFRPGRAK